MFDFERYFRVRVDRVIDGDTLEASLYLGLGVWLNNQRLRLLGINAPEMKGETRALGIKVRDYLADALKRASDVVVRSDEESKGKYGRFLVVVLAKLDGKWVNVNKELMRQGAARAYESSDASDAEAIFDPPNEDIEKRLQVDEKKTRSEVYDESDEVLLAISRRGRL